MEGGSKRRGANQRPLRKSVQSQLMSIDPKLLDVVVCPKDKGPLRYLENEQLLVNERLGIAYRIEDSIPVLLESEAQPYPATENKA